ncbi:MAG: ankyrin repeat domain-containing protein [Rhodospirillales bacterium]|nr:ankyrin repeat domain-containing protein [Rhodospirillales bacterium]
MIRTCLRLLMVTLLSLSIAAPSLAQTAPSPGEVTAYTGLHAAVVKGNAAEIERLIRSGVDLNSRDGNGRTPLMVAAHRRDLEAAILLVKAGADLNALDHDRYDVLTISGVLDDEAMVALALYHGADAKLITSPYDGSALIATAHLGHDGVVRALIKAGAALDHINNLNWTALIEAIVLGNGGPRHQACVRALVGAGADVNLADGHGVRPLSLARRHGYKQIIEILEAAGAKP